MKIVKDSVDVGIVVRDVAHAMAFYRDVLELREHSRDELPGGGVIVRLTSGRSLIKLMEPGPELAPAMPGGYLTAYGLRYVTFEVADLTEVVLRCLTAGYTVATSVTELRPNVRFAVVEDPDSNWVELVDHAAE